MIAEVQIHAVAEAFGAEQGVQHADDFGALLVHRGGVEIVDGLVLIGADRVRHGAGIFGELRGAQHAHVFNALDRTRRFATGGGEHVGRKLLIAEDGQAFLEGELKPVAAGDTVAGPVMEVFMGDHALDVLVVHVGGGVRLGEHELGVEDVEALVLHRAHVEIADGDDHVAVEIELQAEGLFVPAHGVHQRIHGVIGAIQIAVFHPHLQQDLAARARRHGALERHQIGGNQGEQVARLEEGVFPHRKVPTIGQLARIHQVAVRQQHREGGLVGLQRDGEARHHVRPIGEAGDPAEALGFALGVEPAVRVIETGQLGVGRGVELRDHLHHRRVALAQVDFNAGVGFAQRRFGHLDAIHGERHARQPLGHQHQRPGAAAFAVHAVTHHGGCGVEREVQLDALHGPGQRLVVGTVNGRGVFGFHSGWPCRRLR